MRLSALEKKLKSGAEALDEMTCVCRIANHRIGEEVERQTIIDTIARGHLRRLSESLAALEPLPGVVGGEEATTLCQPMATLQSELRGLHQQYALLQESHRAVLRQQRKAKAQWQRLGALVEIVASGAAAAFGQVSDTCTSP